MTELVADCPRCGAHQITFNLVDAITTSTKHGWQNWYETFCVCRQCLRTTVFVLSENVDGNYEYVHARGLVNLDEAANRYVTIEGIVSTKDRVKNKPPQYVPDDIEAIFREAASCMAINCYNAAGTMFRLCIDLVTRGMLPTGEVGGLNHRTRRDLGLRLQWLFENKHLPESLKDLSSCVREDGNDGAHAGTLSSDDAEDLLDFTSVLLDRIYTEPERLRVAEERRKKRRDKHAN